MKISEIRNNLFGLSDLKGLIKENTFGEAKPKAGAPSMTGFFEKYPEFIGKTYRNCPELRSALYDYFQPTEEFPDVTPFPHPDEYETLPANIAKKYYTRVKNGMPQNLEKVRKINKQISFNDNAVGDSLETQDKPTSIEKTGSSIDFLNFLFTKNGGGNITYPVEYHENFLAMTEYIDKIYGMVETVGDSITDEYGYKTIQFNDNGLAVGNEEEPFLLFLLFFYKSKYYERRGNKDKTDVYIQNVKDPNAREYVKYILGISLSENVFNIVMVSQINSLSNFLANEFSSDIFLPSRSAAYFKRYSKIYPGIFSDDFLNSIVACFGGTKNELFDPLGYISDDATGNGMRKWCKNGTENALKSLVKPPISADRNKCSPIEKIFMTAGILDNLLDANYKRFGSGPAKSKMTIDLLLEEGGKGIDFWNSMSRAGKIPKAQVQLRTIYDTEKSKTPSEPLPFWRILSMNSEIKDKIQGEIYYFLVGNSAPNVVWTYEYNRNKKTDTDLDLKSIDILGEAMGKTFCFEYQGEQHYRPITVTYEEYDKFPFFSKMREYILTQCGFIQKTVGGTKFFTCSESVSAERLNDMKKLIIEAYRKFSSDLTSSLAGEYNISSRLNEVFAGLGKINRTSKFESDTQILSYFQKILEESEVSDVFEEPPMEDVVPYVGSPRRFLDEVKTAIEMGRDIEKREIVRGKEKLGWLLSYVIPKGATEDEKKYTEELAGDENLVFPWDKEGKEKLLGFMEINGILADNVLEENTLFNQIISELISDSE